MDRISADSVSKSPLKAKLVLEKLSQFGFSNIEIIDTFQPFLPIDFEIAHTNQYITDFFEGIGKFETNDLPWSRELVKSVTYTNASLYNAIKFSTENPEYITFSPTSGFHHAKPNSGNGFCTFSGQVIASIKLYNKKKLVGCYFDLDAHFGNSIEDSRLFVKNLNNAIPKIGNINPVGRNSDYFQDFKSYLPIIADEIRKNNIHYLVWCHGADSHSSDDLGGQCNTRYWLQCATTFYKWLKKLELELGKCIPLTLTLFGGYRKDDFDSVINLHVKDIVKCSNILLNTNYKENLKIKPKTKLSL